MAKRHYKLSLLTQKQLKRLLHYNPKTGIFTWRIKRHNGLKVGDRAGYFRKTATSAAYIISTGCYNGQQVQYSASWLAWLYMTGRWPKHQIDHKNHDPSDNRFYNLREATSKQNNGNKLSKKRLSKTGAQNIYYSRTRYRVTFRDKDAIKVKGTFKTIEEAIKARDKAAREMRGEFSPF